MKTKHTEGKWMLAKAGENHYQVVSDKPHEGRMGHSDETLICDMAYMEGMTEEEVVANTKITVSAPELLKALNGVCKSISAQIDMGWGELALVVVESYNEAIEEIKKATE